MIQGKYVDKKPLIVGSICAVVLLVLGSLNNVVGYRTFQASSQIVASTESDQKELMYKTITNNKEIQRIFLNSRRQKEITQFSDQGCDCEKQYPSVWSFPVICGILNATIQRMSHSYMVLGKYVYVWLMNHNRSMLAKLLVVYIYLIAYSVEVVLMLALLLGCIDYPWPG